MRRSGKITASVLADLMKAARPGSRPWSSTRWRRRAFGEPGGIPTFKGYRGFPGSICASVNDEVVHGIPGPRVLREGDLLSIDIGTTLDGYVSDSAATVRVGTISSRRPAAAGRDARVPDARHRADATRQPRRRHRRGRFRPMPRQLVRGGARAGRPWGRPRDARGARKSPTTARPDRDRAAPRSVLAVEPMITQGEPQGQHS